MEDQIRSKMTVVREKAILVAALLPDMIIDPHDPLSELRALSEAAGAIVVDELLQHRPKVDVATFIGKGKVAELAAMVAAHKAHVVVFENDLSPSQIANIEEEVKCKVLDRSELILDIFAARAKTYEAKLQVELAQLEYTYPRLRAMWSHLERIVGGAPTGIGTRGPGEQQLEVDRRIVQRKMVELRKEIKEIQSRKEREVSKRNKDYFTVGLVGYTNAGKSTLFNTVTGDDTFANDMLFATLSTKTRKWELGEGDAVMLSDTVGFVQNLPHHLVASFRATLEEAVHSDLLLLVLDVAHARAREQMQTVLKVLSEIGATEQERVLVLNKVDLLENNADLLVLSQEFPDHVAISAKTGRGINDLVERVRQSMRGRPRDLKLSVDMTDGKSIQFIETRSLVIDREYEEKAIIYKIRIGQRRLDQLRAMGARMQVLEGLEPHELTQKGWAKMEGDGRKD
ncbi:MAG: GTPase HflX [Phycisphaeraceae bacterium]